MTSYKMYPRIVLVPPPIKVFSTVYPMGLGYIAAVLKKNSYDVKILDYSKKIYSSDKSLRDIIKINPDFIGFTVYSFAYNAIKEMIFNIKKNIPKTKVIVGGPHVSALPKFSLEDLKADFAIVGEGEQIVLEMIQRIESKFNYFDDFKGLAFWKNNVPMLNPGCNLINDLDNLPFPSWELIPPNEYNDVAGEMISRRTPVASILTSRGCPHQCTFCASHMVHGRNFRRRSAQNVVDEIEFLVRNYGVKEINIIDDTFSENREHAMSICKEIIKRNLDITWRLTVGLRLDTLNKELLEIFKASGCYKLSFGIESFSEDILKRIKKPIARSQIFDKIRMVKEYKIETFGYFILGLPGDTEETIKKTIQFARNSDLDYLSFTNAIPLPGTEIFNKRYRTSDFNSIDWDDFNFFGNRPFDISKVPIKKLKRFFLIAYVSSYCKPKRIIKLLCNVTNFNKVKVLKMLRFIYCIAKNLL